MMRLLILVSLCFTLSTACNREGTETGYLKAQVIYTSDLSCYKPVLSFEEDATKISQITKQKSLLYTVTNFPDSLLVQGKKLFVLVEPLPADEGFACNTFGIAYPPLKIITAKER